MPELERLIADWRATLERTVGRAETIRELEAHLRDHIDALVRSGVPAPVAFEQAVRRLGEPQAIAREFSRARRRWWPESAAEWILVILVITVALVTCLLAASYAAGRFPLVLATHVFALMTGYLVVFATGLIAACALVTRSRRAFTELERGKLCRLLFRLTAISSACLPVGIALGMWWAAQNLEHAWSWTRQETGAAFVFASTLLLLLAQLRTLSDRLCHVMAVMAGVTLAVGVFVAGGTTGGMPIGWLWIAVVLSLVTVLLVRSSPPR
jgi:hypothetical protein